LQVSERFCFRSHLILVNRLTWFLLLKITTIDPNYDKPHSNEPHWKNFPLF